MKKKSTIILGSVVAVCALCLVLSQFIDWPINFNEADGDIAKSDKFSRKQDTEKLTNMEELLQADSAFKDGMVAAQVVMQARAIQFGSLADMSNEVAGNIPAFAEVLKDMNATNEVVTNVNNSLMESGDNLNAALDGKECPDLAQKTINASLAYTTLQKQNSLATRFIETTDKYLETNQGDDRLKFVRDQWLEYQQTTAALEGDKASAEALAKKGNLLKGEKVLGALALFSAVQQAAMMETAVVLEPMGATTELSAVLSKNNLNNIVSLARAAGVVEGKASVQDLQSQQQAMYFAQQISKQLESRIALKAKQSLANKGQETVLELNKVQQNLCMSQMNLCSNLTLGRAFNRAMGYTNKTVGQKAQVSLAHQMALAHQIGLAIQATAMGHKATIDLKADLASKADIGAKASVNQKVTVGSN